MTKIKKQSSRNQPTLFDYVVETTALQSETALTGSFDITKQLKDALAQDLRHACDERGRELSRYEVAARMSNLLGEEITKTVIDNWTAQSHLHRLPADYLPAWIRATGAQRHAAEVISRCSGLFLLPGPEALRAEFSKHDEIIEQARAEKRKLKALLHEIEQPRSGG